MLSIYNFFYYFYSQRKNGVWDLEIKMNQKPFNLVLRKWLVINSMILANLFIYSLIFIITTLSISNLTNILVIKYLANLLAAIVFWLLIQGLLLLLLYTSKIILAVLLTFIVFLTFGINEIIANPWSFTGEVSDLVAKKQTNNILRKNFAEKIIDVAKTNQTLAAMRTTSGADLLLAFKEPEETYSADFLLKAMFFEDSINAFDLTKLASIPPSFKWMIDLNATLAPHYVDYNNDSWEKEWKHYYENNFYFHNNTDYYQEPNFSIFKIQKLMKSNLAQLAGYSTETKNDLSQLIDLNVNYAKFFNRNITSRTSDPNESWTSYSNATTLLEGPEQYYINQTKDKVFTPQTVITSPGENEIYVAILELILNSNNYKIGEVILQQEVNNYVSKVQKDIYANPLASFWALANFSFAIKQTALKIDYITNGSEMTSFGNHYMQMNIKDKEKLEALNENMFTGVSVYESGIIDFSTVKSIVSVPLIATLWFIVLTPSTGALIYMYYRKAVI